MKIVSRNSRNPVTKEFAPSTIIWAELEALLSMVLESGEPLIGLGKPGERIGAGRIGSSESAWKEDFRRLAAGARIISPQVAKHYSHVRRQKLNRAAAALEPKFLKNVLVITPEAADGASVNERSTHGAGGIRKHPGWGRGILPVP